MADSTATRKTGAAFFWSGLALIALWCVLYLPLAAYPAGLPAAVARGLLWCAALLFVPAMIIVAAVQRRRQPMIIACAALVIAVLNWFFGIPLALHTRFALLHDTLSNERERLSSGQRGTYWSERAIDAQLNRTLISKQAPVAFIDGGMLDNWSGFVFDPTGQLATAPRQYQKMPSPTRTWFGGDMTYALPLGNGWFYCWFT